MSRLPADHIVKTVERNPGILVSSLITQTERYWRSVNVSEVFWGLVYDGTLQLKMGGKVYLNGTRRRT